MLNIILFVLLIGLVSCMIKFGIDTYQSVTNHE